MTKKIDTIAQKSLGELQTLVKDLKKQLMKLRLDQAKNTLKNTRSLTNTRKQIAQALTAIGTKKGVRP